MTIDAAPTHLYRSPGERAVRAQSRRSAATKLALRVARRKYGVLTAVDVRRVGFTGDDQTETGEVLFAVKMGRSGERDFWHHEINIAVRRA